MTARTVSPEGGPPFDGGGLGDADHGAAERGLTLFRRAVAFGALFVHPAMLRGRASRD